ncbi:MAG: nucleoside triphosphate pyrophosphohydrolase [Provencibacterium sp.]|nr:nucleoside triphosphate pyrophosphohydrolase [Provencibacterium sp.]
MKTYHKLVRDKIPEIIREQGEIPHVSILSNDAYQTELEKKLREETAEYLESREPEELADILEVVFAPGEASGCSPEQLNRLREEKHARNEAFQNRYYLISKEEGTP